MSADARAIVARFAGTCASCDEDVDVGDRIYFHPATKLVWHRECPEPKDLGRQERELAELRRLGLEAHEFGSAPMPPDVDDEFDHNDLLPDGEIFGDR